MLSGCQNPRHVFFYFYPFLAPVGVPKFAWLWKTNAVIISYCIYSYLIDHIKPYIRIYIYTYAPYIYNQYLIWSYKNIIQHLPICIHPTSDFTISFHSSKRLLRDHGGPSHRSRSGQRPYHLAGHCHRRRPHWRSRPVLHCLGRRGLDWMRQKGAI